MGLSRSSLLLLRGESFPVVLTAAICVYIWKAQSVGLFLVTSVVLSLALYRLWLYPKFLTPFKELPTLERWHWLRGNCGDIYEHVSVRLTRLALRFSNERLVRVYLPLNIEVLFLTSPRALHEMLTERSYQFTQPKIVERFFQGIGMNGLVVTNGSHHKTSRRHLAKVFSARNIRSYYPDFLDKAWEMVKLMEVEQRTGETVAIRDIVNRTIVRVVCATLLGYEYGSDPDEPNLERIYWQFASGKTLLGSMQTFLPSDGVFGWLSSWSKQYQRVQELRRFARKLLEKGKGDLDGRLDMVSCMLQSGTFTKDQMVDEILTSLAAGFVTTTLVSHWAIIALCQHPDIQQRLREEVRHHLPRPVNEETRKEFLTGIDSLPYLSAFCNEVFRHYPSVSMLCRQAACDTTLDGVHIPNGTILMGSPHVANHNPAVWGPTASSFNPDRWMENDGGVPSGADTQCAFLTFGQGPRSCIGQSFIQKELLFRIALMSACFEMELDDTCKDVGLAGCVLLVPKDEIRVRLRGLDGW